MLDTLLDLLERDKKSSNSPAGASRGRYDDRDDGGYPSSERKKKREFDFLDFGD